MKTSDINAFKGQLKNNLLKWAEGQIDQLLPGKVAPRVMLKNLATNSLARFDHKVDQAVDAAVLMFGDPQGNIDSDTLVDFACDLLKEMSPTEYPIGPLSATVGKGEIRVQFPHNAFSDLLVGNLDGVRITTADIQEIKKLFI